MISLPSALALGYKAITISTIVDNSHYLGVTVGYKAITISTIVDSNSVLINPSLAIKP